MKSNSDKQITRHRNITLLAPSLLVAVCMLVVTFSSCYKDKGNYDYQTINDIAIVMADTVEVNQGEALMITPVLQQATATDESRLKYEWGVLVPGNNRGGDSSVLVISNERNLNTVITQPTQSLYYPLSFKVKDTVTGITYRKMIRMLVKSEFLTGWTVLEQTGAGADISFINTREFTALHAAYSSVNPTNSLPASARQVVAYNVPSVYTPQGQIPPTTFGCVLFENDGFLFDPNSFAVTTRYSQFFNQRPATVQPQYVLMDAAPNMVTINAGKLYRRLVSQRLLVFGDQYLAPDALGYSLAPYATTASYSPVFFDEANHRFLREGYLNIRLGKIPFDGSQAFDPNDIDKKILTLKLGRKQGFSEQAMAVFKSNNNDSCYLYAFSSGDPLFAKPIENSPGVANSPNYLFASNRSQMYYAAGNKLYLYDIDADNAREIYTFAAGEEATMLEMQDNGNIAVATHDGSSGTVYLFSLEGSGDITGGTYTNKFTGFGKIISMAYRG